MHNPQPSEQQLILKLIHTVCSELRPELHKLHQLLRERMLGVQAKPLFNGKCMPNNVWSQLISLKRKQHMLKM